MPPNFANRLVSASIWAAVKVTVALLPSLAVMLLISERLLVMLFALLVILARVSLMATCRTPPRLAAAVAKLVDSKLLATESALTLTAVTALPKPSIAEISVTTLPRLSLTVAL